MSADLEGKRCLIVGASSGIGAAVAQRFGALGVKLVVHCNDNRDGAEAVVAGIRAAGGSAELLEIEAARAYGMSWGQQFRSVIGPT